MMGQAIEDGAGEAFGAEDFGPFIERQVGSDDDGAALMALRDDFEQQLRAGFAQGNEAEFVDDQHVLTDQQLLQALQSPVIGRFDQLMHQSGGRREADLETLLASRETKAQSDVGFAGSRWSQGNDILAAIGVFATGKLHGQDLVERGDGLEVETVEAFRGRKLRRLDPPFDHPALALDQLQLAKPQQILHMILALCRALAGQLAIFALEGRQSQRLEVMLQ